MPDKTKMILRNDIAKERNNPVNPELVSQDLMDFINEQEHWADYHSPTICWGILTVVFNVVFGLAPSKEKATEIILDALSSFAEKGADA